MESDKDQRNLKACSVRAQALCFCFVAVLLLCSAISRAQTKTDAVEFSYKRGFYTDSIQLELSSPTASATIRFTLDGSKPSSSNGQMYTGPISIRSNLMVRAYAHVADLDDSKMKTHSYIFPDQVIRQEDRMLEDYGYDYSSEETGKVFWTEAMDPEIVDASEYKDEIIQGLKDIPSLSVVMAKEDLWGENGIHWGDNLENRTDAFERECSIEMIYPEGYKGDIYKNWQENAGIRIQGGGGRWDKGTYDHKQSFTLVFKNIFGAGKLKNEIFADAPHGKDSAPGKYDNIVLRSSHNKGWGSTWDREKSVYTRDQLGRDLQILMSGFGSHGTFVHLYLNGKYWGLYNPCERPDHNFLANHLGGESEDYFYAKGKDPEASADRMGEPGQTKTRFYEATSKNYSLMPFEEMKKWVMVDQSIASLLVYGYANPGDSPQYYYGNSNNPYGPVVWIPWDIEDSFGGGSRRTGSPSVENMIDSRKSGDNGIKAFWTNIDFRMRFTDLVYQHFYNDGAMTDENVIAAFDSLNNYIYRPIICESARWGDERSSNPMDRDNEWDAARLAVRKDLEGRADNFISKLRNSGYYSKVPAPKYMSGGTEIVSGIWKTTANSLTISGAGAYGTLYYTTDGTDPRTWDLTGSVSANAKSEGGSTIAGASIVKARIKQSNNWSPLHEIEVLPENSVIIEVIKPEIAVSSGSCGNEHSKALHLYPNPVSNKLFLSEYKAFAVYSSNGTYLFKGTGTEITMTNLTNGLYFIIIDNVAYKILKVDSSHVQ